MGFLFETKTGRDGSSYLQVKGYEGRITSLVIPESHEGLPVRSIASHAFAGKKELKEAIIPASVTEVRSFAFFGCSHLKKITLSDTLVDYYDGVIRNCPELETVTMYGKGDNFIIVREMLRDIDNLLRFRMVFPDKEIRLTFPEWVSEAREDTYARAIHLTIEGAGMAYRECVSKTAINYAEYDRYLPRLTDYDFAAAMDIALDRLMYPEQLRPKAEEMYRSFLADSAQRVLLLLVEAKRPEDIVFMLKEKLAEGNSMDPALKLASENGETEICGILMEYGSGPAQEKKAQVFTLDDLDW